METKKVAQEVRRRLGSKIFKPAKPRLLWLLLHILIIAANFYVATSDINFLFKLLSSILAGMSFAGGAFVAHESLHGALTRNKHLRYITGFIGFLPFCVSPRLWKSWHNSIHHSNTNIPDKDPDAYPTLEQYNQNFGVRTFINIAAPQVGRIRGIITLLIGFTTQSLQVLFNSKKRGYLNSSSRRIAFIEAAVGFSFWLTMCYLTGFPGFIISFIVPLLIGNSIVMAHIITNHGLCKLSDKNDALETSMSVTVPKWFEFYSLGFGYHVEHHMFPSMSTRHAPEVRAEIKKIAPECYKELSLMQALYLMFTTPRVYKEYNVLIDPNSGVKKNINEMHN